MDVERSPEDLGGGRIEVAPSVAAHRTDHGMLLFDAHAGTFLELDDIGAEFWEAITSTTSIGAAVERICTVFGVDRSEVSVDLAEFIGDLTAAGLLGVEAAAPEATDAARLGRAVGRYLDVIELLIAATASTSVTPLDGVLRIRIVRDLAERAIADGVPGDFMAYGVTRSGATVALRAVLEAYEIGDRRLWIAGVSDPAGGTAVPSPEVAAGLGRFGLLGDRVRFVDESLPDSSSTTDPERLAILWLDGALRASTADVLASFHDRLSPGGFVIVDDYLTPACRAAIDEYLADHGMDTEVRHVDWSGAWWQVRK
ncbi:MAG: PqqD family peptide modification chaperone [Ilumatobacteraceae bacterium]